MVLKFFKTSLKGVSIIFFSDIQSLNLSSLNLSGIKVLHIVIKKRSKKEDIIPTNILFRDTLVLLSKLFLFSKKIYLFEPSFMIRIIRFNHPEMLDLVTVYIKVQLIDAHLAFLFYLLNFR